MRAIGARLDRPRATDPSGMRKRTAAPIDRVKLASATAAQLAAEVSAAVSRVLNAVDTDDRLPGLRWDLTASTGSGFEGDFLAERAELLAIAITDPATAASWAGVLRLELDVGSSLRQFRWYRGAFGEWQLWLYGVDGSR